MRMSDWSSDVCSSDLIAGTICDGPQDLRRIYPNDDGKGVKSPVICFENIFQRREMQVGWSTIRKPMGLFKKEHLQELLKDPQVATEFRRTHNRDWTQGDLDEMFSEFRPIVEKVAVSDELVRPIDGVQETR